MKNRKIAFLMIICMFMFALAGCAGPDDSKPDSSGSPGQTVYATIDAYWLSDGMLSAEMTDGSIEESQARGLEGVAGQTVAEMLQASGIKAIKAVSDTDQFEGWMEYEVVIGTDEDGFDTYVYELRSGDVFYSDEEFLEKVIPEYEVTYVAKWASIPVESYFAEEDYMFEVGVTTGAVNMSANGGTMFFGAVDGSSEYDSEVYTYWLEEGQTMTDAAESGEWDAFLRVEKEGAEFTGWTVYEGSDTFFSSEEASDEGQVSYPWFAQYEGFEYIILEDSQLIAENMSTDELVGIAASGTQLLAAANWK